MQNATETPGGKAAAEQSLSPANTAEATEKPTQCTVKIKGASQDTSVREQGPAQVIPAVEEKGQPFDLHFRDIEQNIESIESGLEQIRLGRIEEAKQCKIQIKEMEERIELTRQGLNTVKKDRIEEAKKIRIIEEHIDMTKKGLEQIKLGRMEEAKHYKEQLKAIEGNIELTRKGLKQVNPATAGQAIDPPSPVSAGTTEVRSGEGAPVTHSAAGRETESPQQIKDIEDIIGVHHEVDPPVTPRRIRLASVLLIFFVVLLLGYFAFFT